MSSIAVEEAERISVNSVTISNVESQLETT
jgi:hypothetical protein